MRSGSESSGFTQRVARSQTYGLHNYSKGDMQHVRVCSPRIHAIHAETFGGLSHRLLPVTAVRFQRVLSLERSCVAPPTGWADELRCPGRPSPSKTETGHAVTDDDS